MSQGPPILRDHRREGKKFIPPMVDLRFTHAGWTSVFIPNLVWISLLYVRSGRAMKRTVDLVESLVRVTQECTEETGKSSQFISIGDYYQLTDDQQIAIRLRLSSNGILFEIQDGLGSLISAFPECPLRFIFTDPTLATADLSTVREAAACMFYRAERDAMFIQAVTVGTMMATGKLHVMKDSRLGNLEAIVDYPLTDESRAVGSVVRATVLALGNLFNGEQASHWASYFWRRGLELEPCE